MNREVRYEIIRAEDTRERHYHKTEGNNVIYYSVQLEVFVGDSWRVVIRFDCAHGYAHIDRYNLMGERLKAKLDLEFKDALTAAEENMEQKWKLYRQRFMKGEFP
ncbi:hypothetical protein HYR54_00055 [Candidatus Acetothermia bacterium]|nr:hypothetical protein [Candidatus Acetothermia bacterium]